MDFEKRSNCPISFTLDLIGDRWSLLILRDIILFGKKHYHEFVNSSESISTNILADRLQKLECAGLLLKKQDMENKKRFIYTPTQKALGLIPMMLEIVLWGAKYDPESGVPVSEIRKIKRDRKKYVEEILARFERT